jgi:hypothetical protein
MVKCDNCSNDAAYTSADPGVNPVNYCTECLPHWLHERAAAGHFPLVTPTEDKPKKAAKKDPVEPAPTEEPAEEPSSEDN